MRHYAYQLVMPESLKVLSTSFFFFFSEFYIQYFQLFDYGKIFGSYWEAEVLKIQCVRTTDSRCQVPQIALLAAKRSSAARLFSEYFQWPLKGYAVFQAAWQSGGVVLLIFVQFRPLFLMELLTLLTRMPFHSLQNLVCFFF